MIALNRLRFVESLGDNCEMGFAVRKLGDETGSYFRWVAAKSDAVATIIEQDFADTCLFENLVPHPGNMVRDIASGAHYHAEMYSTEVDGRLEFKDDPATLLAKFRNFHEKHTYLVGKFRKNLSVPGMVYVVKSIHGPDVSFDRLAHALASRRRNADYRLLEVRVAPSPDLVGKVVKNENGRWTGFVRYFAPFNRTADGDQESWVSIFDAILPN